MRASIDLGTNTCLLLIQDEDGKVVHDQSEIVRLGEGLAQYKKFQTQAMQRTLDCLKQYAKICDRLGFKRDKVVAVATASARNSLNTHEFFKQIQNETGFVFRTISGDQEARATFLGAALPGMDPARMVVMDIGGGSTELVNSRGGKSIDIGAVKVTELYLKSNPPTDSEFWAAEDYIDQAIFSAFSTPGNAFSEKDFVAVAGTATTLAQIHLGLNSFDAEKINSTILTKGDVHRWVEELKWRTIEERKQMPGMEIKRADVILGGALIFWRVMELFNFSEAKVSTRGLRYGVFTL